MDQGQISPELIRAVLEEAVNGSTSMTVSDLLTQYAEHASVHVRCWTASYRHRVPPLARLLGDKNALKVTPIDITRYRSVRKAEMTIVYGRPTTPATRNREVQLLRRAYSWAVAAGLLKRSPLTGISMEDEDNRREAYLDEDQFQRALEATKHKLFQLVMTVAFDTGMRRNEVLHLTRDEVDLEKALITINGNRTKARYSRIVPLTKRAVAAIERAPRYEGCEYVFPTSNGRPFTDSGHNRLWYLTAKRAGLEKIHGHKVTFHTLRHSCAKRLIDAGVQWPVVKAILGWKSDAVAARYMHIDAVARDRARTLLEAAVIDPADLDEEDEGTVD